MHELCLRWSNADRMLDRPWPCFKVLSHTTLPSSLASSQLWSHLKPEWTFFASVCMMCGGHGKCMDLRGWQHRISSLLPPLHGTRDWTQVTKFVKQILFLLCHLAGPKLSFKIIILVKSHQILPIFFSWPYQNSLRGLALTLGHHQSLGCRLFSSSHISYSHHARMLSLTHVHTALSSQPSN